MGPLCKHAKFAKMQSVARHAAKRTKTSHIPMVSTWGSDKCSKVMGIYVDVDDTMYFTNDSSKVLQRSACFNQSVFTIAGNPGGMVGYVDGDDVLARFNGATGLVKDKSGNIIVVDTDNNCLRKISRDDATVSTIAGSDVPGLRDGDGIEARFNRPRGIVVTIDGDFVVSDSGNNCLRLVTASGAVSTLCGSASGAEGFDDGQGLDASFHWPTGMAIDLEGNVLVADTSNDAIRHVTVPGGVVTTFAGTGLKGFKDGPCFESEFSYPRDVAIDGKGVVIVADSRNNRIRKIEGGVVRTVVGINERGSRDGPASTATLDHPTIVKIDNKGRLVVAEMSTYDQLRIVDAGLAPPACMTSEPSTAKATSLVLQDYKKLMRDETFAGTQLCVCVCVCVS